MPGRIRNTKRLSQRIDRNYFKKAFFIPRWRRLLAIILGGLGLGWIGWRVMARDEAVFSSGPLTHSHAILGKNCSACHKQSGEAIADQTCRSCHDGPIHQARQVRTPGCIDCHVEHQGHERLAHASETVCIGCHSDLKTQSGQPGIATKIRSFTDGHPEFAAIRTGQADPGGIKLNHKVHLKKDLRGPNGNVTLQCSDCHRPFGARGPSSYGRSAGFESIDQIRPQEGSRHFVVNAYMAPVNYYEHCSGCHPLDFDARLGEPAPHKPPVVVREFLMRMYTRYIQAHAGELRSPSVVPARVPRLAPEPAARNQADWVVLRVEEAERLLWAQACNLCHTPSLSPSGAVIPEIREARITTRWLPNGEFSHSAHVEVACTECHRQASSSERSSEILVPGIQVCRQCHNPQNTAAGTACFECHQYHDWSKEVVKAGSFRIKDIAPAWGGQ